MKQIIGLIGEMAAGKTTATEYIQKNFSAVTFRFSDALRDVLKRLGIEISRGNMQTLSTILRQSFGEDLLSKAMLAAVNQSPANVIIVEGIRRPSDVTYLKDLPGFKMIYLSAAERTRFDRLVARRENADDANKTWEQFQKDGLQEPEQEIKVIAAQATATIDNNGTLEDLYKQLSTILA